MGEGGKLSQCVHKTVQYGSVWTFEGFLGDLMLFQDILIPSRAIIMAFFKMAFSKWKDISCYGSSYHIGLHITSIRTILLKSHLRLYRTFTNNKELHQGEMWQNLLPINDSTSLWNCPRLQQHVGRLTDAAVKCLFCGLEHRLKPKFSERWGNVLFSSVYHYFLPTHSSHKNLIKFTYP